jgi:hypothetical protein
MDEKHLRWFKEHYEGCNRQLILIHPAGTLEKDAYTTDSSWVIRETSFMN